MDNTKTTIGFREISNSKKTILISIFALWICTLVWLIISLTHLDSTNPSRKFVVIIGFGFILITGILNNLYKRFRTSK
jgi:hypothetical protein